MEFIEFLGVAGTFLFVGIAGYTGVRLVNVWVRRLMGSERDENLSAEMEELRARVHELESVRIMELEERVDFTERLLAQTQEAPQIPIPGRPEREAHGSR